MNHDPLPDNAGSDWAVNRRDVLAGGLFAGAALLLAGCQTGPAAANSNELPGPVWVAGYSNDVFSYVPSRRVLEEGGYEGRDAISNSSLPGPFAPSVEERITGKVREMAQRTSTDAAASERAGLIRTTAALRACGMPSSNTCRTRFSNSSSVGERRINSGSLARTSMRWSAWRSTS